MKTIHIILLSILSAASASAEFRTWTRGDGKTAELELISVTETNGEKAGTFTMRSGQKVVIKTSVLSEPDARLLAEWKTEAPAAPAAASSVFDDILDGNLKKLSGKSLKSFKDLKKPSKYYVFYYTASWCGPCQQFTPTLVEFYEKNKNDSFEIILITSDSDENSMEDYAVAKKMPWPQLELKKADDFKKKFKHGVTGIPSVITCSLDGEIVSRTESITELVKLLK
jgi:thiol-disulfide isomerase/thioredoxin